MPEEETVPQISVVVPTYERGPQLRRCLHSLQSQNMKKDTYEVIVIDDGSSEDTANVVDAFRQRNHMNLTYSEGAHCGPATARNRGIRLTRGTIVAFLDDDCIADQNWLRTLTDPFSDAQVSGVEGRVISSPDTNPNTHRVANIKGGRYLTANIAYRKSILQQVGCFDERFRSAGSEDLDLAFRVIQLGGKIAFRQEAIVYHSARYESFERFRESRNLWYSNFRLYVKHPDIYTEHSGRNLVGNLLYRTLVVPIYKLLQWRKYWISHPREFFLFSLKLLYELAFGVKLLLPAILIAVLIRDRSQALSANIDSEYSRLKSWHEAHDSKPQMSSWLQRWGIQGDVLEVGCGVGQFLSLLPSTAVGLDASSQMLLDARDHLNLTNLVRGDAHRLPLKSSTMDWIIANQVIEHLADIGSFLAETKRVLRTGGRLFVTTPNRLGHLRLQSPLRAVLGLLGIIAFDPGHIHEYIKWELERIIRSQGFEMIALDYSEELPGVFRPLSGLLSSGYIFVAQCS